MARSREVKLFFFGKAFLFWLILNEAAFLNWFLRIHWEEWVNATKLRKQKHLLTIVDQTLAEVQAAHDTNDEANENKKRRNGGHRAKETPLDKSPSERRRIKHGTPPDEVQSRQDEEHDHGELQLQSRCKPALRWRHQRSAKMDINKTCRQKPRNKQLQRFV
jgi:hypothetical protein